METIRSSGRIPALSAGEPAVTASILTDNTTHLIHKIYQLILCFFHFLLSRNAKPVNNARLFFYSENDMIFANISEMMEGFVMAQTNDIAIDLGTSNVIIYMKGKGIVFREPCVVAVDRETNNIIAFGMEAYRMIGRTPANVNIIRPLAQGEMLDFELTSAILRFFVTSVIGKHIIARPRAVMAVPSGVKDMEKKALISSMFEAGIRRTQLMDKNIAAALGAQPEFSGIIRLSCGGYKRRMHRPCCFV